jgi:hypothetical protein
MYECAPACMRVCVARVHEHGEPPHLAALLLPLRLQLAQALSRLPAFLGQHCRSTEGEVPLVEILCSTGQSGASTCA